MRETVRSGTVGRISDVWRARRGWAAGFFLWILVLATFWPALHNGFVGYDDPEYVTANPHVQQGLSWATLRWAFSNYEAAAWHPLTWLSHALDYQLFGLGPFGHHLTGVLLHALNAVFCFLVLSRLTGALGPSWAVAALFALHPLRVESVAWVSERKDVLSLAFFFLTVLAYTRYVESGSLPQPGDGGSAAISEHLPGACGAWRLWRPARIAWYGWALVFFFLGLMSKPMLVTTPFVLLLLDLWPLHRWSRRSVAGLIMEKLPLFLAAALVSLATLCAQPAGSAASGESGLPARLPNALVSYCRYLGKLFWPADLAPFYPPVAHWPAGAWLASAALLLTLTGLVVWQRHNRPYLLVGWLWFLGTLVPVIGLVQIGEQSIADRYSYLPSIGILLSLVWGINELTACWRSRQFILGTVLGILLVTCLGLSRRQINHWKDSETLFRYTLSVTRGNYLAHNNLGVVFAQDGKWSEAVDQYQRALALRSRYPEALKNLGVALDRLGQTDKAIEAFQGALAQRPDFVAARNGLGLVYERQGRFQDAAQQFRLAVQTKPDYADAHFNLALELERQGRLTQAVAEFEKTLQIEPNSPDAHNNLGVVQEKQGQLDAAIQSYQVAIRLNPKFARAHFNLGVALTRKGQISAAIPAFEEALRLKPDYPAARTNLSILKSLAPQ